MTDEDYNITGDCSVSWELIRDLFRQNFIDHLDLGATLCIYYQGKCVVDLVGGWFDSENRNRPFTRDTLQLVYSTGKGIMATALAICVERGWLAYEERVATYWPDFEQNGKQNIKVKDLLSHRAGLFVIDDDDGLLKAEDILEGNTEEEMNCSSFKIYFDLDPSKIIPLLAKQKPHRELDAGGHSYHALTFGYLADELIRRVDLEKHRSMGKFIQEEIAPRLDNFEYYFANCFSAQHLSRVSPCTLPTKTPSVENQSESRCPSDQLAFRVFTLNGLVSSMVIDSEDKRLSPINGYTNARSLARIYASLLFSEDLLTSETLSKAVLNNTPDREFDQFLGGMPTKFAQGGFMLDDTIVKGFGKAFGHWGTFVYLIFVRFSMSH